LFFCARRKEHFVMKAYPVWVARAIERKYAMEIVNDHMKYHLSTGYRRRRSAGGHCGDDGASLVAIGLDIYKC